MFDQEQIVLFGQRCLMVVGGFAAGYLLTWIAGEGFDRVVTKRPSPQFLHKWARVIGGVVVALVVAFMVFRGGKGSGEGTGEGTGTGPAGDATSKDTSKTPPTEKLPEVAVEAVPVRVTVYAGNAVELGTQRFFAVNGGAKAEVGAVTAEVQKQAAANKAGVVIVYALDADTATEGTTAFLILKAEAGRLNVPLVSDDQFRRLRAR